MIVTAEGNEIKLYGRIWQGDENYIISELTRIFKATSGDLNVHVHTPGGSVLAGNMIFNFIMKYKDRVNMIVDGLAASMGSIIMLAGKRISIAENAFVMIHAPSGYEEGNRKRFEQTAKVLGSMEESFLQKLSAKTGKDKADLADWMNGDNWFSAQEALDAGLVDEIINPIIEESSLAIYQDVKACASLFSSFEATTDQITPPVPPAPPTRTPEQLTNNSDMKIDAQAYSALGLQDSATDADVNARIMAISSENTALKQQIESHTKQRAESLITSAVAAGKIPATEKEQWVNDAVTNFEMVERTLDKIPAKPAPLNGQAQTTDINADTDERKDWTFDMWRKQDPAGLRKMHTENPEAYAKLKR